MGFKSLIYDKREIEESSHNWPTFFLILLLLILGILLADVNTTSAFVLLTVGTIGMYTYLYRDWGRKDPKGNMSEKLF